jgi:uncharacterized protein DUF1877
MGMYLELYTLSDENIEKVLADPPLIWKVVAPENPERYDEARNEPPAGLLSKIFGRNKAPAVHVTDFNLAEGEVAHEDVDKAWHGIHYLLTKTAWEGEAPLDFIVRGGREVGDIEVGYDVRLMTSNEVQSLNAALQPIDEAFLKSRYNPSEMMRLEIYPEVWDRDPEDEDNFGYCLDYFNALKSFVAQTANRNMGIVIYFA